MYYLCQQMELQPGTYLKNGHYRIERILGQGGFGITYLATTEMQLEGQLGTMTATIEVAVKEFFMKSTCQRTGSSTHVSVPTEDNRDETARYLHKFLKEAHNMSGLKHPHIAQVFDVFEENGTAYYVMEYLPGGSLDSLMRQQPDQHFSESEAVGYVMQIASALQYMHEEHHTCHYDVKPNNIMLDKQGQAKLIDFGLSKRYDSQGHQTSTTPIGVSAGFAPIEQYNQELQNESYVTDVYSLGATLLCLLTGNIPPEASVVINSGLPDCPDYVSQQTWHAIERAMQTRTKDRPQSIREFASMLEEVRTTQMFKSEPIPTVIPQQQTVAPGVISVSSANDNDSYQPTVSVAPKKKSHSKTFILYIIIFILSAVITATIIMMGRMRDEMDEQDAEQDAEVANRVEMLMPQIKERGEFYKKMKPAISKKARYIIDTYYPEDAVTYTIIPYDKPNKRSYYHHFYLPIMDIDGTSGHLIPPPKPKNDGKAPDRGDTKDEGNHRGRNRLNSSDKNNSGR